MKNKFTKPGVIPAFITVSILAVIYVVIIGVLNAYANNIIPDYLYYILSISVGAVCGLAFIPVRTMYECLGFKLHRDKFLGYPTKIGAELDSFLYSLSDKEMYYFYGVVQQQMASKLKNEYKKIYN